MKEIITFFVSDNPGDRFSADIECEDGALVEFRVRMRRFGFRTKIMEVTAVGVVPEVIDDGGHLGG